MEYRNGGAWNIFKKSIAPAFHYSFTTGMTGADFLRSDMMTSWMN
jgi:hypothetical protein